MALARTLVLAGPNTGGVPVGDAVDVTLGVAVAVRVGVRVPVAVRVAVAVRVSDGSGLGGIALGTGAQIVERGTGPAGVLTVAWASGVLVGLGAVVAAAAPGVALGFGVAEGLGVLVYRRVAVGWSVSVGIATAVWVLASEVYQAAIVAVFACDVRVAFRVGVFVGVIVAVAVT